MQIYKRGAIWWYRFRHNGSEIRRTAGPGATKTQAQRIGEEHRRQLQQAEINGRQGLTPRRKFDDALLEWLQGEAQALRSRRQTLNHVRQIRDHTRDRWLHEGPEIAKEIKKAQLGAGLKPATVNQRLAIIRRVLNLAYEWGWIDEPLGTKVKLLNPHNERHLYLLPEELFALAEAAANPDLLEDNPGALYRKPPTQDTLIGAWEAILVAGFCGLRLNELYLLTPDQLRNGALWMPPTKGKRAGNIPLPELLHAIGLPLRITPARLRTRFEIARRAIGKPELHFHDLRHTFASLLADSGAQLLDLRDLMRHVAIQSTTRYAHLLDERKRQVAGDMHRRAICTKVGTT